MMRKIISASLMVLMTAFTTGIFSASLAFAASVTSFSDTLTTDKASTAANHTIVFTTPTGITSGQTVLLTFDNSTSINASLTFADIDVKDDGTNVTLAASPTGATWGAVRTSSTVITLTNGTTAVGAGSVITVLIGTNATNQSTGTFQITNGTAGTTTLTVGGGTFADSGTVAMPIIANDVVAVTGTVNPTISFAISATSMVLGTSVAPLTSANGRWADTSSGQVASGGSTPTAAHTMTVSTNATGGYIITQLGATLTSGSNTIPKATISADSDGTPGTAQFGSSFSTAGSSTITSTYARSANSSWDYANSTTTPVTIVTASAPVSAEVITASYLANISGTTPAGAYTASITYVATGTF